jgi:hypothetical protein
LNGSEGGIHANPQSRKTERRGNWDRESLGIDRPSGVGGFGRGSGEFHRESRPGTSEEARTRSIEILRARLRAQRRELNSLGGEAVGLDGGYQAILGFQFGRSPAARSLDVDHGHQQPGEHTQQLGPVFATKAT